MTITYIHWVVSVLWWLVMNERSFEAVHESVIYIWEEIFLFLVTKGNLILLFFTRSKFN